MPSQYGDALKRHVDEVMAYSEEEFVQFMKDCRRPEGGFDIELDGWDTLVGNPRERLVERLK